MVVKVFDAYIEGEKKATGTIDYEFYKKKHINFTYNASIVGGFIFNATKTCLNKPSSISTSF